MHRETALFSCGVLLFFGLGLTGQAASQCMLGNPSFELSNVETTFECWTPFGAVGSVGLAKHGTKAARVSGRNSGTRNFSGVWQKLDCEPGQQWAATGHLLHPEEKPLTGQSVALVNIEWHNAAGAMISYESFTVAGASTGTGQYIAFSVLSEPAPSGTASAHIMLGVMQAPGDASCDVLFDQISFTSTSPPTAEQVQWLDFPSTRELSFSGYTWRIKGPGQYAPGNNWFAASPQSIWVDDQERLHLTLKRRNSFWSSTEIVNTTGLGYGDYILTTVGPLDQLDPHAVLGIFLWSYVLCWDHFYRWWNPSNEIDIEYSRWGDPSRDIGQFVVHPSDFPGNMERFDARFGKNERSSHAMRWLADRIEYRIWRGGPEDESAENLIHSWTYRGPQIPRPENPRLHMNLWKYGKGPSSDQEVIFEDFTFVPVD